MNPASLARIRSQLTLGAQAAAATCGLTATDVIETCSLQDTFRQQLGKIQTRLATLKSSATLPFSTLETTTSVTTPSGQYGGTGGAISGTGTINTQGNTVNSSLFGTSNASTTSDVLHKKRTSGTAVPIVFSDSRPAVERHVMLDPDTKKLVDIGHRIMSKSIGVLDKEAARGGSSYQYTTLEDTLRYIRAYRPISQGHGQ